jgi:hypothetical protein
MAQPTLTLHPRQGDAYLSAATELLFGGGAGGGKSHFERVAAIAWCIGIPGLQVYFFRRTNPDLQRNHMSGPGSFPMLLAPLVSSGEVRIVGEEPHIRFSNGSAIHLCHCQYEKDLANYQGAEIHVLIIDELTQWPKDMYTYLRGRMRLGGLQVPEAYQGMFPRAVLGTNPGGIGHNWVKMDFVDSDPLGTGKVREMPRRDGGMQRAFIRSLLEDNPTQLENDPDYEYKLEGMGSAALVKAMRRGEWDIVAGGAVDDVWAPEVHILPPFDPPKGWHIDRAFDWGSAKPFSVGWWAESDGTDVEIAGRRRSFYPGTLFRIAEWYGWNGEPNKGCQMIDTEIGRGIAQRERDMGIRKRVKMGPADSSIFDESNVDSTISRMSRGYGSELGMSSVDIFSKAPKGPGSRERRLEALRSRLKAAMQQPMEEPGLFVVDTCQHFIRTVPTIPRSRKNPNDVDTESEDHAYDEAGYRMVSKRNEMKLVKLKGI